MKTNRGYTLIEVIVSIAVLGIISVFFLGAMTGHISLLNKTKEITKGIFLLQREMEEEIDIVKAEIRENNLSLEEKTIFDSLGGLKVNYYPISKNFYNREYYTLVSDVKPDPLELIKLESIDNKLYQYTDLVGYGYGTADFNIKGSFKNLDEYKWDHMLNQVDWYVSNPEYNMPMPKEPSFNLEDDILYNTYYFPLFPRDYEIVDNETIFKFGTNYSTFNLLPEFAGRNVIFTVTPAAKSGKLGIQSISKPVFISGLPNLDNIVMHFDASYIDVLDSNEVKKVGTEWHLNKWIDISSIIGKTTPNRASVLKANDNPIVMRTNIGEGFIGQYVRFKSNQYVEIRDLNTIGQEITVISVIKNHSKNESTAYFKNGGFLFNLDPNTEDNDYQWEIRVDSFTSDSNHFYFGGKSVDIAEVIIYNEVLEELSDELTEIKDYLFNKYDSPKVAGDIVKLIDMEKEIKVGDVFNLPDMVLAEMERGTQKYVSVTWLGNFDSNVEGIYELVGSAKVNPTKKMTYTVNVVNN